MLGNLAPAVASITQFAADGNAAQLTNANVNADAALVQLMGLASVQTPDDLDSLNSTAASYRETLEKGIVEAKSAQAKSAVDAVTLGARIGEISTEFGNLKTQMAGLIADYQTQFLTAQSTRATEYTAAMDAFIDAALGKSDKLSTDFASDREKLAADQAKSVADLDADYKRSAGEILESIEERKKKVEKLVGVVGNLALTSGYLTTANHARKTMWVWQAITVASLVGLIVLAYEIFIPSLQTSDKHAALAVRGVPAIAPPTSSSASSAITVAAPLLSKASVSAEASTTGDLSWEGLAARLILTLTVGALAAYAATQADKFMTIERRNRKLALELEAIGPYVQALEKSEQDKFLIAVGERTFGHDDATMAHTGKQSPATLFQMLADNPDLLSKLAAIVKTNGK